MATNTLRQAIDFTFKLQVEGADKADKAIGSVGKTSTKTEKSVTKQKSAFRGLNFEYLGTMFFGMAVAKTFDSMLKPASDLFNISELWGLTLQSLLLPTMSKLFPVFLWFSKLMMSLPEPMKKVAGTFILTGSVLGHLVMGLSQAALGIESLIFVISRGNVEKIAAFNKAIVTLFRSVTNIPKLFDPWKGLSGFTKVLKVTGTVVLLGYSVKMIYDSLKEPGIQYWGDIVAGVAGGLGLAIATGTTGLGVIPLIGAVMSIVFALDIVIGNLKRPGIQWWSDIVAAILTGLGVAFTAAILGASAATAATLGFIAIPLGLLIYVSLDWIVADAKDRGLTKKEINRRGAALFLGMPEHYDSGMSISPEYTPTLPKTSSRVPNLLEIAANTNLQPQTSNLYNQQPQSLNLFNTNEQKSTYTIPNTIQSSPASPQSNTEKPSQNVNMTNTYNIAVSDARELERALEENATKLRDEYLSIIQG